MAGLIGVAALILVGLSTLPVSRLIAANRAALVIIRIAVADARHPELDTSHESVIGAHKMPQPGIPSWTGLAGAAGRRSSQATVSLVAKITEQTHSQQAESDICWGLDHSVGDVEWPGCGSAESQGWRLWGRGLYRGPRTRGIVTLLGLYRMPGGAGSASGSVVGGSGWSRAC